MGMRRVIRFKPELLDLVLKGVKTSTVRPVNGAEYGPDLILTDMLALLLVMTTTLPMASSGMPSAATFPTSPGAMTVTLSSLR
jgi:hypothetical protein